jgi:hypothetical protein
MCDELNARMPRRRRAAVIRSRSRGSTGYRRLCGLIAATVLFMNGPSSAWAQGSTRRVGHFEVSVPSSWKPLSAADTASIRREFEGDLGPGLKQYYKTGEPEPRMGEFAIFQKPSDAQMIGWTLIVPPQIDFLKEILRREAVEFEKRKNLAGAQLKGGTCRLVRVGDVDVVRVDVAMANGGTSTNLHYWSPKNPTVVSILMLGIRPHASTETENELNSIIAALTIKEDLQR